MSKTQLKPFPHLETEDDVHEFVMNCDLSQYDFSQLQPVHFELDLKPKDNQSLIFISEKLNSDLQEKAKQIGLPFQQFITETLVNALKN